jgi:hypothetical protein
MPTVVDGTTGVDQIQSGTVTEAKIANGAVTPAKLADTLDLSGKTLTLPAGVGGPSGQTVKTWSYNSGYGAGARTVITAQSWQPILTNGTARDALSPVDNSTARFFDKERSDTHLRIRGSVPIYISPGNAGVGIRTQMVLSNDPAQYNNAAAYFTVGSLVNGPANGWGAAGYGGNTAAIINFYVDTAFGNPSVLTYTGRLHFYFMGYTWQAGDSAAWIDYFSDDFPKYATWTVEEYIP